MVASEPDTCQVWWARAADARPELVAMLPEEERSRHRAFVRAADRDLYLAAHALTRLVLSEILDQAPERIAFSRLCEHCGADHGKPRLPGTGVELSLSHSGDWVVVAVARERPVGVDVERVNTGLEVGSLAETVLSPEERHDFTDADVRAFFAYWCRKEAILKATGEGLAVPMHHLSVSAPDEPPALLSWSGRVPPPARLTDLRPDSGHLACLAVLTDAPVRVTEHDGSAFLRP